ncbi:MAG: hypothetical protein GKR88_09015 [Flavobacteriaceae bacterium]|nr:MAG: hypothetical protein GKR88_09015 [Flavobacteriaceae bacterium]
MIHKKRPSNKQLKNIAKFSGLGLQMILVIGVGVFLGIELDEVFSNSYQIFTLICSLVFLGIAVYYVVKQATHLSNSKEE